MNVCLTTPLVAHFSHYHPEATPPTGLYVIHASWIIISSRSLELLVAFTAEARERGGKCEQDGGVEGGAVLRTVLWKSEQWQQYIRLSRQTDWQRAASLRGLSGHQGKTRVGHNASLDKQC